MQKNFTLFLGALLISGCATTTPLPNHGSILKGKTITAIHKKHPKHPIISTDADVVGQVIGGIIGGAIVASAASKKYNVTYENPSNQIAKVVANEMVNRYSMQYLPQSITTTNNSLNLLNTNPTLKDTNPYKNYKADYLVDVETNNWTMMHDTMFIDKAMFSLKNNVKIIDRKRGKVIAQTQCSFVKKWEGEIPKYKEVLANNQQFIKNYTQKAVDACINKVRKDLFK